MKEIEKNSEHTQEVVEAFAKQRVQPQYKLYKCLVCGTLWKKLFFITPFFKDFPKKDYCSKECRKLRHKVRKDNEKMEVCN